MIRDKFWHSRYKVLRNRVVAALQACKEGTQCQDLQCWAELQNQLAEAAYQLALLIGKVRCSYPITEEEVAEGTYQLHKAHTL